jgi:hypothetical protein
LSTSAKPRNSLQDSRVRAALDKSVRENGEQMTRRQWVERKVAAGLKTRITQEDRIKPMSRMAYFRANNEEQRAHERRVKEAGKKDVYWIGDYEVTKIEHDYANRLAEQASASPTPQAAEALDSAPNVSNPTPQIDTPSERVDQAPAGGGVGAATERTNDTAAKLQARQDRKAKADRDEPTIELRKRLSVLKQLKECLG